MNRSRVLLLVASMACTATLYGCSKNDASNDPSDVGMDAPTDARMDEDRDTGADDSGTGGDDTGNGGADVATDAGPTPDLDSSALREAMEEAFADAPASLEGMTLLVHDQNDARVVEITVGDFGPDRRVAIASASKLVSGLVLLHMVDEGALEADETTDSYFDWQDGEAQLITLDQLGGFTSGLPPNMPCRLNPTTTLQDCAATIGEGGVDATPGTRFDYGSSHLQVAASMAEQATDESWADLFDRTIKQPLGLDDPGLRYFTLPRQEMGDDNPLVAGGLRATADEYMEILSVVYHQGNRPGDAELPSSLVSRMYGNPYTAAEVGQSPMADQGYDYRYGFGTWLLCEGAVANCARVGSAGAFGFTPWVDRDAGYYAVLAMEMDLGGSQWAFPLSLELMPLIEDALP